MKNLRNDISAKLVLEDGTTFLGKSFGYPISISGEVVFSTGMVGYPESMTDPSYKGQILVLTFPLIGNYGISSMESQDNILLHFESSEIQVQGLIVSEFSQKYSHNSAIKSLQEWLYESKVPAIYDIDTRTLTRKIREHGVMLGKIIIAGSDEPELYDPNKENLVSQVSTKEIKKYGKGQYKIIVVDCGLKNNILRSFLKYDVIIRQVPWDYDYTKEKFDGVFISNGPGDPKMCQETVSILQRTMEMEKPIFGICLGHQLLALAAGGDTYKLRYGHRSQNQPCVASNNSCYITAQNHGFAVDMNSLSSNWKESFRNINDNTNEGIEHVSMPFFSSQFHPEGSCGPQDTLFLFEKFLKIVDEYLDH